MCTPRSSCWRPSAKPLEPDGFRPALSFCFDAIPKGKRYALFPGKPLRTFSGIALLSRHDARPHAVLGS
ncbi:hypothetical protein EN895_30915, partial [Mesorhizobium sp. M7A.F.Ca.CA.002.03.2.1]